MRQTFFLLLSLVTFLCSCGGVVGSVEKYEFEDNTLEEIKRATNQVCKKHPELVKPESAPYGQNNGKDEFYFLVHHEKKQYVLKCNIIPGFQDIGPEISLTSATKMGEIMKLASNMSYKEKRLYRTVFEKHILPKIKKEL